jgi:hypothetical protein
MQAVKAAIDELMAEIQVRQEAVEALRRLCPLDLNGPIGVIGKSRIAEHAVTTHRLAVEDARMTHEAGPGPTKHQAPRSKLQGNTKHQSPKGKVGHGGKSHPDTWRIAALVEKLKEPFKAEDIAVAAKLDWKKASNFVTRGKLKGWLMRSDGKGEYLRTAAFPFAKQTPKHEVLRGPGTRAPGRTKAIVESEMATAVKERDAHRVDGRTSMEGIAQKRVDRLEEELEAMP